MSLRSKIQSVYFVSPEHNAYSWPGYDSAYCFPLNSGFSFPSPRSPTSVHEINLHTEMISGNFVMEVRLVEVMF
jgi:hypothetical protein